MRPTCLGSTLVVAGFLGGMTADAERSLHDWWPLPSCASLYTVCPSAKLTSRRTRRSEH